MSQASLRLLDGGMGRELQRIGAPFRQPEWSALALIEAPDYVLQAHQAFIEAGARIITTNSYAVVPFHIGDERFAEQGRALAERAGRLARQAAAGSTEPVMVAGSLPPALGSYRPDLFDHQRSVVIHRELIAGLQAHVDVWLAETQSSIAEVRAVVEALGAESKPLWLSFTLLDEAGEPPRLRSSESVAQAVHVAVELGGEGGAVQLQPAGSHGSGAGGGRGCPSAPRSKHRAGGLRKRVSACQHRGKGQQHAAGDSPRSGP